ncbi:MAG: ATP-binding cassette domain-containing protein [Brevinematales bacterium]|nr:ATP-binding cassette domain-containing protein [Brevinematales bacterium]
MSDIFLDVVSVSHTFFVKDPNKFAFHIPVIALERVSFSLLKNTTFSIVGESGSGKTTLGNVVLGAIKPTQGNVFWKGKSIFQKSVRKEYLKHIHAVSQNPLSSLNPRMSVRSIILEPLLFRFKLTEKEMDSRLLSVIDDVKLSRDVLYKYPHELSGGEKQRVSIARSIISRPSLVVLDEPVSSLDVSIRSQILNLLVDIKKQYKLSYLYISHDISTTRFISDYLMVLYKGRVMEVGLSEKIFSNPKNPYTLFLLSSVPGQKIVKDFQNLNRDEEGNGCPFYSRCPVATEICKKQFPQPFKLEDDHVSYCHNL